MKKALTTTFVIIFTLLFTYTCFLGNAAMAWASEMDNMTHFDLYSSFGLEKREAQFQRDANQPMDHHKRP